MLAVAPALSLPVAEGMTSMAALPAGFTGRRGWQDWISTADTRVDTYFTIMSKPIKWVDLGSQFVGRQDDFLVAAAADADWATRPGIGTIQAIRYPEAFERIADKVGTGEFHLRWCGTARHISAPQTRRCLAQAGVVKQEGPLLPIRRSHWGQATRHGLLGACSRQAS